MIDRLKRAVGVASRAPPAGVLRECRQCGTAVEGRDTGCPACGSTEIARYEL